MSLGINWLGRCPLTICIRTFGSIKVPLKERYATYNQATFMNKNLQKAIMKRSRLLNRCRKEKKQRQIDNKR